MEADTVQMDVASLMALLQCGPGEVITNLEGSLPVNCSVVIE